LGVGEAFSYPNFLGKEIMDFLERQEKEEVVETIDDFQCEQCGASCRSRLIRYLGKVFCSSWCLREYKEERK
jgi:hypothetical protein